MPLTYLSCNDISLLHSGNPGNKKANKMATTGITTNETLRCNFKLGHPSFNDNQHRTAYKKQPITEIKPVSIKFEMLFVGHSKGFIDTSTPHIHIDKAVTLISTKGLTVLFFFQTSSYMIHYFLIKFYAFQHQQDCYYIYI